MIQKDHILPNFGYAKILTLGIAKAAIRPQVNDRYSPSMTKARTNNSIII
jgi:hypothetical protein